MNLILLTTFGTLISFTDFKRQVIPNRYLLAMLLVVAFKLIVTHGIRRHLLFAFLVVAALALFQWASAGVVGTGDIKYLALLAFLTGSFTLFAKGIEYSFFGACIMAIVIFLQRCSIRASIPLAPPITVGFFLAMIL
jgi:Flp pilus assembly protein protease CpaA